MSESHEYYKAYKNAQERKEKAQRRGSNYISDYEKDERIARLEWKEKEREAEDDFKRGWNLLSLDD